MNKLPLFLLNHFELIRGVEFLHDFLLLNVGYLDLLEAGLDGAICDSEVLRLVTIEVK
jgi:hypothetical protein